MTYIKALKAGAIVVGILLLLPAGLALSIAVGNLWLPAGIFGGILTLVVSAASLFKAMDIDWDVE